MAKKSFLLVSLKEDQAKKLAQVISNDTCRNILDYLTKKNATESELSKELSLPISTVHYNLQHLLKAKLVKAEEYHYSKKGKEVLHYSLSNQYIIIAPESTYGLKEKLKKFLPIVLIVAATAGIVQFLSKILVKPVSTSFAAEEAVTKTASAAADQAVAAGAPALQAIPFALWFLYGALFAVVVYFIYDLIKK